jgi:hypothetical protein
MNNFVKGMGSFNLFPQSKNSRTGPQSAWGAVGKAFRETGNCLRKAMYETSKTTNRTGFGEPIGK